MARRSAKKSKVQIPPRPPLPKVKYRLQEEERVWQGKKSKINEYNSQQNAPKKHVANRFVRFMITIGIISAILFLIMWVAFQPFAQPFMENLGVLFDKGINFIKNLFRQA